MSITRVRARFRITLHHSAMACRVFVLERPALHRLVANTTARHPALRRWLVRRIDGAQALPFVQAAPVMQKAQVSAGISLIVPTVTAAEVDHVRYLFQRATDARR
jgi:hypothetical protein